METQGLTINQLVMSEQLDQTSKLFKNNKRPMARAKLNAALNLCISCHSQSPGKINKESAKIFADKDIDKLKITDYERAEIYFVTRDFEKAIDLYDKFLVNSKKADDDEFIFNSFKRELIYFIKFKQSFSEAKSHFEKMLKQNAFNEKVTQEVNEWIKALSGKSLWDKFEPNLVKEEEMD